MSSSPNYLAGYPAALVAQIEQLIAQNKLGELLQKKYPQAHEIRTDKALYVFVLQMKDRYLRNTGQLNKVMFDNKLHDLHNALGTHTRISRVQGGNLTSKRELRISSLFKDMPAEFLQMIVAHELAHLKEREHNKAFYQLCQHIEPSYPQLEFDLRTYLTYLGAGGKPLWNTPIPVQCV
ncbi:MAG: YgjP-like metallopeptidase domain-containing protein [Gallionellaceae bacterium]